MTASNKRGHGRAHRPADKHDREPDNRQRYGVSPYRWSRDSKYILFDSCGQLWLYTVATGTAVHLNSWRDPLHDPKLSPDGSKLSYIRNHNRYVRDVSGGDENELTHDHDSNILNGEVDWLYAAELSGRSNYFWSHDGKKMVLLQMNETSVPTYPITDFIPQHPTVDNEKY